MTRKAEAGIGLSVFYCLTVRCLAAATLHLKSGNRISGRLSLPRRSAANAECAVGRLNLMSGATALGSGSEPERALGGIDHSLAAATVRIIDELVELHARVRTDVQIGLVVKPQTGLAGLVGTDGQRRPNLLRFCSMALVLNTTVPAGAQTGLSATNARKFVVSFLCR
jgi:hypothetical protein